MSATGRLSRVLGRGNRTMATQTTVGNPSNRRSGESRNPELSVAGTLFSGEFPGFRLSPERRFYETGLCYGCPGCLVRQAHHERILVKHERILLKLSCLRSPLILSLLCHYPIMSSPCYVIPTGGRNLKCWPLTPLKIFRFLPAVGMTRELTVRMTPALVGMAPGLRLERPANSVTPGQSPPYPNSAFTWPILAVS